MTETEAKEAGHQIHEHSPHTETYGPGGGTPFQEHMHEGTTGTTTEGIINHKMAQREKL